MDRALQPTTTGASPDEVRRRGASPGKATLTEQLGRRSGAPQEPVPGRTAALGDAGPDAQPSWELIGDGTEAAQGEEVPKPLWPNGPSVGVARKSTSVPLADYVAWLREVERVYGVGPATIQRLRRLYYGTPAAAVGAKFDLLLDTDAELMLTAPPLPQPVLDRLFETDTIVTPSGVSDPSHILVLLDLDTNGASVIGHGVNLGAPLAGLFTWTGDLASWFVEWYVQYRDQLANRDGGVPEEDVIPSPSEQLALLQEVRDSKVSKEDLIGNMDAHALEPDEPGRPPGQASIASAFERYFATSAPRRFQLFVQHARPAIPHDVIGHNPLTVALAGDAERAIYDQLWWAVMALRTDPIEPVGGHTEILAYIARAFTEFLVTGLATGDAPW